MPLTAKLQTLSEIWLKHLPKAVWFCVRDHDAGIGAWALVGNDQRWLCSTEETDTVFQMRGVDRYIGEYLAAVLNVRDLPEAQIDENCRPIPHWKLERVEVGEVGGVTISQMRKVQAGKCH